METTAQVPKQQTASYTELRGRHKTEKKKRKTGGKIKLTSTEHENK